MTERLIYRGGTRARAFGYIKSPNQGTKAALDEIEAYAAVMRERAANATPPSADRPITIHLDETGTFEPYVDPDADLLGSELTVEMLQRRWYNEHDHGDEDD
ncbi:hypothetical protein MA5S0422_3018 [Mycobacteroides abscessus 5S-0422]|uniref:Uncharacterized protein n=1 Tax=Mycobacteroides abscessus subsp. bolletii 1513 TaxID=1299321 RepID=X8DTZ3_9MYCO|nr:hypothetical protein [Mycobacteroides abscessus]EUA71010.1 hypothetical protein I540_3252 [Mycobacteroides abscessus subsp. bolletii 1513]EIU07109.1 hypothetical protein MA5S0421_2339 [Mycobacteroides abscessus 5S-0421]EIU08945.1 hypothetical protein MA5S0304_2085 [Mycobacteroides abscessus 5S-0304]EIU13622.1 hypothetical protein MA5S0422_3018 [Mycobacteroides abscessus 5S-0422]EIU21580.1 hypothetical protein MA5S0708_5107 [Mycobacteroides abscessus 5S-0708]